MFSVNYTQKFYRPNKMRRRKMRKHRMKTLATAIAATWKDFCTTSSFVGFRYVYRKGRSIIDFVFWFLLVVVLMYCSINFIAVFIDRFRAMSTTTVIKTHHKPSSRSVFPGITVCLSGRISKTKLNAFIADIKSNDNEQTFNLSESDLVQILNINQIPDSTTLITADNIFSSNNLTLRDLLDSTTDNCEEIFTVCRFAGKITPCSKIFKKTAGGTCCSFNYPIPLEQILKRKWLRTNTFGMHGGLSFAFRTFPDDDYHWKSNYGNTITVVIHPSHSYPSIRFNNFFIPNSTESALEINSVYNMADEKVRNLPVEIRDCIFAFEKSLSSFVRYSHSNCLLQCRIDRVMNNCGCVSYFYPIINMSEVCSVKQLPCSIRSKSVETKLGDKMVFSDLGDCDCPDDCFIVKQYAKLNLWDFSTMSKYSVDDFYSNVTDDQGIVHVFYGKSTVLHLQRKLAFDEIELASNLGGIVSIFLGCSFISLIEIIYFFTLRMLNSLQFNKVEN